MPVFCFILCCLWQANSLARAQALTHAAPVHRVFYPGVFFLMFVHDLLHMELTEVLAQTQTHYNLLEDLSSARSGPHGSGLQWFVALHDP